MVSAISQAFSSAEKGRFRYGCYEICYEIFRSLFDVPHPNRSIGSEEKTHPISVSASAGRETLMQPAGYESVLREAHATDESLKAEIGMKAVKSRVLLECHHASRALLISLIEPVEGLTNFAQSCVRGAYFVRA